MSLLSLSLARSEGSATAARGVRAAALRLLLDGRSAELPLEPLGWSGLRGGLVRGSSGRGRRLRGRGRGRDASPVGDCPRAAVAAGLVPDDPAVVVVVASAATAVEGADSPPTTPESLVAVGIGDGADVDDEAGLARSSGQGP